MAAVCVAIFCLGQKGTRKKYFISCAFAGYLDILSRQKSAL